MTNTSIVKLSLTNELHDQLLKYSMNGFHIPIISVFLYLLSGDIFLSSMFFCKMFSYSFYTSFHIFTPYPGFYYWKHMVRLTDSGHIASLIFYFNKDFLPVAHNVHFIIASAFWICRFVFDLKSTEEDNYGKEFIVNWAQSFFTSYNHIVPYLFMIYNLSIRKDVCELFDENTLLYTYMWCYTWIIFIYIPWVYLTNDYVYSIFKPTTSWKIKFSIVFFVHILIYISNNLIPLILC